MVSKSRPIIIIHQYIHIQNVKFNITQISYTNAE